MRAMKEDQSRSIFQDGIMKEYQDQELSLLKDGVMTQGQGQDQEPRLLNGGLLFEHLIPIHCR